MWAYYVEYCYSSVNFLTEQTIIREQDVEEPSRLVEWDNNWFLKESS